MHQCGHHCEVEFLVFSLFIFLLYIKYCKYKVAFLNIKLILKRANKTATITAFTTTQIVPKPFVYQLRRKDDSISAFYKTNAIKKNTKCTLANDKRKLTACVPSFVLNETILPSSLECFSTNKSNTIVGGKPEFS